MKISQEDEILIWNLYLSKRYGARRTLSEFSDNGWKVEASTVCLRESARMIQLSGNHTAVDRVQFIAVENLVLSHEESQKGTDQLKKFCMKLPFPVQMCTG